MVVRKIKDYQNQKRQVDPCGGKNPALYMKISVLHVKLVILKILWKEM